MVSSGKHMKALCRRRDFLRERTRRDRTLTFDISELRALEWAIEILDGVLSKSDLEKRIEDYLDSKLPKLDSPK